MEYLWLSNKFCEGHGEHASEVQFAIQIDFI